MAPPPPTNNEENVVCLLTGDGERFHDRGSQWMPMPDALQLSSVWVWGPHAHAAIRLLWKTTC